MAYNLMVEFPQNPNWRQLSLVASDCGFVEMFPIPEEEGEPAAAGICVPLKGATNDGLVELTQVLDLLRNQFGGRVIDLYSGHEIVGGDFEAIRKMMLG